MTGGWFGTCSIFPSVLGAIIPSDFHIFQRGGSTTNQMGWWDENGWWWWDDGWFCWVFQMEWCDDGMIGWWDGWMMGWWWWWWWGWRWKLKETMEWMSLSTYLSTSVWVCENVVYYLKIALGIDMWVGWLLGRISSWPLTPLVQILVEQCNIYILWW